MVTKEERQQYGSKGLAWGAVWELVDIERMGPPAERPPVVVTQTTIGRTDQTGLVKPGTALVTLPSTALSSADEHSMTRTSANASLSG